MFDVEPGHGKLVYEETIGEVIVLLKSDEVAAESQSMS